MDQRVTDHPFFFGHDGPQVHQSDAQQFLKLIKQHQNVERAFRHLVQPDGEVTTRAPTLRFDDFQWLIGQLATAEGRADLAEQVRVFAQGKCKNSDKLHLPNGEPQVPSPSKREARRFGQLFAQHNCDAAKALDAWGMHATPQNRTPSVEEYIDFMKPLKTMYPLQARVILDRAAEDHPNEARFQERQPIKQRVHMFTYFHTHSVPLARVKTLFEMFEKQYPKDGPQNAVEMIEFYRSVQSKRGSEHLLKLGRERYSEAAHLFDTALSQRGARKKGE